MSHHIVEAIDLEYTYPDATSALSGVSFRIGHGESVAIVGANGAGKSTLLAHLADRPPYKLSGGQKRAVAIATVLAMAPDILVMDEPSAGLDPRARRQLIALLLSFTHTKIVATHDLDLALEVCTRTIILIKGKVAADALTAEVLRDLSLLEQHGLELPLQLQGCPVCGKRDYHG